VAWGGGGNDGVNGFNTIENRGEVKGGVMVGRVTAWGGIPRCGAGRRGGWREAVAARPNSGGARREGWQVGPTCHPYAERGKGGAAGGVSP
jgi:hypothetical protein